MTRRGLADNNALMAAVLVGGILLFGGLWLTLDEEERSRLFGRQSSEHDKRDPSDRIDASSTDSGGSRDPKPVTPDPADRQPVSELPKLNVDAKQLEGTDNLIALAGV